MEHFPKFKTDVNSVQWNGYETINMKYPREVLKTLFHLLYPLMILLVNKKTVHFSVFFFELHNEYKQ